MLKVLARINNRKTLFLGITEQNVERLKQDMPMPIDLQALAGAASKGDYTRLQDIIIFYGTDEAHCREQLERYLPEVKNVPDMTAGSGETKLWTLDQNLKRDHDD